MKKLRVLILVFCIAISVPLVYFVLRTAMALEKEEIAQLHYFAETICGAMEEELGALVLQEEERALDAYHEARPTNRSRSSGAGPGSPSDIPFCQEPYVLGYLQNNPDGSFLTPHRGVAEESPSQQAAVLLALQRVNEALNRKRTHSLHARQQTPDLLQPGNETISSFRFAERYLRDSRRKTVQTRLKHRKRRIVNVSISQVLNIVQPGEGARAGLQSTFVKSSNESFSPSQSIPDTRYGDGAGLEGTRDEDPFLALWKTLTSNFGEIRVAVDPMQSVLLDERYLYVYRRIFLNNQTYYQGVVIKLQELLKHLINTYFIGQPMAQFANLRLEVTDGSRLVKRIEAGARPGNPDFSFSRAFAGPFSLIRAHLTCDEIPRSAGRRTLHFMMFVLVAVILMGLVTIYKSTQAIADLSERRAGFVSSVTHELKTPLSTIRMYIEMLEQGVARNQDREQEYYRVLGSECSRLSRLINNVLEFSKLEKKQRKLNLQQGTFEDVTGEVQDIMREKIKKEGFTLSVDMADMSVFSYDREAMIQVLINLIENSIKFGAQSERKEIRVTVEADSRTILIRVADTGPGIPGHAVKKVFENFYRVDNEITRTTGGTGIGLALVKNFVAAMGGTVSAANNEGPGCTVTITLPR